MKLYLTNKQVLKLTNNPEKILNISTNTLDSNKNAFVDVFGKIIVTFDQIKINKHEFLLVIEKQYIEKIQQHLKKFLKLAKVQLIKTKYQVYFNINENYIAENEEYIIPQNKGQLIITNKELNHFISEEEFIEFRIKNKIPIQGIDYDTEMLMNVSEEYISFEKGCFLGQEVFARIKSRSKSPKKLIIKCEDECDEKEKQIMTSKYIDSKSRKAFGFLFVENK